MFLFSNKQCKKLLHVALNKRFVFILFILIAVATAWKQYVHGTYNNYLIFKYVFEHSLRGVDLYAEYPDEYFDSNHYGPIFALIVAPFALLPNAIGMVLWNIVNVIVLWLGIYSLPLHDKNKALVALTCSHEILTSLLSFQFNVGLTGLILLSFSWIEKQQEFKSALMIVVGTLVKLYGIVGLAFFFFCKNKVRFIVSGLFLLLVLPLTSALITDMKYTVFAYQDWYHSLVFKNSQNVTLGSMQDISLMGIVRRISRNPTLPNTPFLLGGLILFVLPYLRVQQYKFKAFKLMLLSSVLIFTVIFSSGSESPTYIIAMIGVALWFFIQPSSRKAWVPSLFVFALLLTSFSPSDLFPRYLRENYIIPYSLKALPCVLIWFVITYQMMTVNFEDYSD
ncbi:glycosyltransferase family 87 protein [Olivibacter sp. CPCC 100613]|uniref:glycosyltransferase family 87 protein n=1 Tax=Olivibacter sp. CPCC 100613 TaxID=3079931 RepID=UPI002FF8B03C